MRTVLFLLAALPFALQAQVNDMFYVPKKTVKNEDVLKIVSASDDDWGTADNGNTRDVDEYNRRSTTTIAAGNVESLLQAGEDIEQQEEVYEYTDESDYNYSTRIVRFHSPTTVVVSSPWYYDVYPNNCHYDSYWDWSIGWNSWSGWGINLGWHHPYSWFWDCAPAYPHHHHHHAATQPVHKVHSRVPTASVAGRGNNRRPVATAQAGDNRKPVTQVNNKKKEENSVLNRPEKNSGNKKRERVESSSSRNKSGSSSTYNRRSSTSVRSSSSNTGTRSRVSGASRSSSSRSSATPSRSGTSRGGRR